jgi:hypothetical protein
VILRPAPDDPPFLEFWKRANGTLPEKIEKADLRTLNLGLGFLFRRLRQAQARFEQEGDSDRQSVFSALGAFWSFITLFGGPFAENLHVPMLRLLSPPSCSTEKSWVHFRPPPVDFCGPRLAIGAASERARALATPAGTRA